MEKHENTGTLRQEVGPKPELKPSLITLCSFWNHPVPRSQGVCLQPQLPDVAKMNITGRQSLCQRKVIQPKYKSNLLVFYIYLLFLWPAWTFNLYLNGIAPAVVLSIEFGRATGGCKFKRCSLSQKHQCVCPLSCFRERKRSKVNRTLFR